MAISPLVPLLVLLGACGSETTGSDGAAGRPSRPVVGQEEYVPSPVTPNAAPAPAASGAPSQGKPDGGLKPAPTAPVTATQCFQSQAGKIKGPNYDQYNPVIGKNCSGTRHQNIAALDRVVFLGDSVTTGTPPTMPWEFYRSRLAEKLKQKFGANLEVSDCSKWGARVDDLLLGGKQIEKCFPTGVETKKTLVVMTMGGNDLHAWMKAKLSATQTMQAAVDTAKLMGDALRWLKDPVHFPNGSYVAFGNVYEYTDTSGDLLSCPSAAIDGTKGTWTEGTEAVVHLEEEYLRLAVETQSDMIFMLESFCGHGYKKDDPTLQCYRGPNTEQWFDLTCIHPTPKGHEVIANMFGDVLMP